MEEKEIKKLKQLLTLLEPDNLTKEEFVKSFELVIKTINDLRQTNSKEFDAIKKTVDILSEKLKTDNETDLGDFKNQMNNAICDYCDKMDLKHAEAMLKIDSKLADIKDGKDADEERIIGAVLAQIPPVKEQIEETPESIRNKLEVLKEDERLDKSAIRGLQEEIAELKKMINSKSGGGGGFKKIRWIAETPSGTVDGVNTTFYLSTTPDPENILVMLNGLGQRNGADYEYVLSGKKITFNSAPAVGSQTFAWFSK